MPNVFFIEQNAFTTGEVSRAVGNRTDLDKYAYALAKAKNCFISPYGAVSKRTGTKFVAEISDKAILERFIFTKDIVYLLCFENQKLSVYLNNQKVTELATPYKQDELRKLKLNQSNDVMIITNGIDAPKVLARYTHDDWRLEDFKITRYPMASVNDDKDNLLSVGAIEGDTTLTAVKDTFKEEMVGTQIEIIHDVEEVSVTLEKSGTTEPIYCEEYTIITNGFWKGEVTIEKSYDKQNWQRLRTYKSNEDANVKEGGANSSPCYLRMKADVRQGSNALTFSGALRGKPRTAHGLVKINKILTPKTAEVSVIVRCGNTTPTDTWKLSYWSKNNYPTTSCFWQNRLWFTSKSNSSDVIFGSRTGDYTNFSVERVSGDLTDDSACIFPIITKDVLNVIWLIGGKDLIILSDGAEYRVDGDNIVTPKDFQASVQSRRGSSECKCLFIGDQVLYVQRGGKTVREMGFSQERMAYVGDDLTIFAKHLTRGYTFVDGAYKQEPNSIIYYVRSDGKICCLSYIKEQQVFAWSTIETDGEISAVTSIARDGEENIYCVVKRGDKYNIEMFTSFNESEDLFDHTYTDSTIEPQIKDDNVLYGLDRFIGKRVNVVFYEGNDNGERVGMPRYLNLEVESNGELKMPCKVHSAKVGLPYTAEIETLNVEAKLQGLGTLQGKEKQIVSCVLRLENSYGGEIGQNSSFTFDIPYPQQGLYTTDIICDVGGERNLQGRLFIKHEEPVPFNLLSLVREVSV